MEGLRFATLLLLAVCAAADNVCQMSSDMGRCKGYFPKFFFNAKTGVCQQFVYGGCGGNGNRFDSVKECQEACLDKESVCLMPSESGMCMAYMPMYFYNTEKQACEQFIYGGCGGNSNRFSSLKECQDFCA
ncbi:actinia tenebrosa protease inhibitors-like [Babylonia areolata]|uniref:actinia tenebrosa protease inhibitors-like n=1 Tax=Babylonia areolata TaxID=304850 RepID=UPI003FD4FF2D